MQKFSKQAQNKLKNYVYVLIDPFTSEIFYVGKASGNRPFMHLLKNAIKRFSLIMKILKF